MDKIHELLRIKKDATFDEWKDAGRKLASVDNALQWHWGEWWNYGHKKWDREAEEFIKTLPLKRKTLKEYGSVSNLVKPSIRMDGLPFLQNFPLVLQDILAKVKKPQTSV